MPQKEQESIATHFSKYYRVVEANTDELKSLAYQLRHTIFHGECGYTTLGTTLNNMETDEHDENSIHILLFHKPTNTAVGYSRVILYDPNNPRLLPVSVYPNIRYDQDKLIPEKLLSQRMFEASRMSLLSDFRSRFSETYVPTSHEDVDRVFHTNYLPIVLMIAVMVVALNLELEYGYSVMEPKLSVLLRRHGVKLEQIGNPFECYGTRMPYLLLPFASYKTIKPQFKELCDVIQRQL